MSINPQFQGHDQYDVMMGSVTSHFSQIDNVLLKNECINGQYQMVTQASYAANTPVDSPGFTTVCISTNGALIADLENSYITAKIKYYFTMADLPENGFTKAKIDAEADAGVAETKFTKYFIGFKQSLDALRRYDVNVNSQTIYSQNFVGQESFVQVAGLNDTIMCNNPFVYTAYKNASTMDNSVCGVYVDLADMAQANGAFEVEIPIKINMHQFLMLSAIHYLPSFCGRWELVLYFDANNIVIAPVNPLAYTDSSIHPIIKQALLKYTADETEWKGFSNKFTQIRDPFYAIIDAGQEGTGNKIFGSNEIRFEGAAVKTSADDGTTPLTTNLTAIKNKFAFKYEKVKLECSRIVCTECLMNITQFQLKYEIYESLMAHYTENPLIIPINQLSYQRFSHSATGGSNIHAIANLPIENCDSIFLLFPTSGNQTTCFYQPYLSNTRLSMGEFGVKPSQYVSTYNDPRFVGLTLDALNLEMSKISAMNKDFSNSIMPHSRIYKSADGSLSYVQTNVNPLKTYDSSYFMWGLSCSQVGFQSGTMSSPMSNINFQFNAVIDDVVGIEGKKKEFKHPLVAMFLLDAEILIQVVPNSDHPVVRVSTKSVV